MASSIKGSDTPIAAADKFTVELEVTDDNQAADGSSQIIATATVRRNGVPYNGATVTFELDGSKEARFLNGETTVTAETQSNGGIAQTADGTTPVVPFRDTLAETGSVYAHVHLPSGENPHDEKPFTFVAVDPDKLELIIENNGAAAANAYEAITAKAKVTQNGRPLKKIEVYFQIVPDDVSAVFRDHVPKPLKLDNPRSAYAGQYYSPTGTGEPGAKVRVSQSGGDGGPDFTNVNGDGRFSALPQFRAGLSGAGGWDAPDCGRGFKGAWNDILGAYVNPPTSTGGHTETSGITEDDGIVEKRLQDSIAEEGTVEAWVILGDEHKLIARQDFRFSAGPGPDGSSDSVRFAVCPKV